MAAASHDFTIEQGVTTSKSFVWKDSEGTVIDLTGYSARMQIRASIDSTSTLLSATNANGQLVITAAQGKVTLTLTATETAALDFSTGVYDLELVSGAGVVTRLVEGSVTLSKEVTK
jgi:hypothetical protein